MTEFQLHMAAVQSSLKQSLPAVQASKLVPLKNQHAEYRKSKPSKKL